MAFPNDREDDWMLDSLFKYERLHVFELQQPTLCMEWGQDDTAIYVAGFSTEHHNELLQLLLPEKLLAVDKQTLLARRDFKIGRGAISKTPIHCIKCIDQASLLATSGVGQEVWLWGPDSTSPDLFISTGTIATATPRLKAGGETRLKMAWSSHHPHTLLAGSSLLSLQMIDLHKRKATWQCQVGGEDVALHTLNAIPEESLSILTCYGMGELALWDPREAGGPAKIISDPQSPPSSETAEQHAVAVHNDRCASLSSRGDLQLHDLRGTSGLPLATCKLPTAASESFLGRFTHQMAVGRLCVQFSPDGSSLSVSGLDRGVCVYNIKTWNGDLGSHEADSPSCKVTVHSWHPSYQSMILSSDSEASLHVWQWRASTQ